MNRGRILNRPLEPSWMDAAFRLAQDVPDVAERRRLLEMRLRDTHLAPQALKKVTEAVAPVWISPPPETAAMIEWALANSRDVADLRAIHLLALVATYPFFGDVCAISGRLLRIDGEVRNPELRNRLRATWGDREVINVAQRKCIQTLRAFSALEGHRGAAVSQAGERLRLPATHTPWAVHAIILGRNAESIDAGEIGASPEAFFADIVMHGVNGYALLERFNLGPSRVSYVAACSRPSDG
jgi:hypothetical protein